MSKRLVLCCVLALQACLPAAASVTVPEQLQVLLEKYRVPKSHIGLYVSPVDDSDTIASLNPTKAFNPASVMKLIPSIAALELLSPAYQWFTRVYADGAPVNGVLNGDLYIEGGGDPYLTIESAWALMKSIHALGIERITGDIVLDSGVFDVPPFDAGRFDDKPYRVYNGPPGGLMINFWSVRFTVSARGGAVNIDAFPDSSRLRIVNEVKPVDASCSRRNRRIGYRVAESREAVTVTFQGVLSTHCRPVILSRAVIPAERYLSYVLPGLWRDAGGTLDGMVKKGAVPEEARQIYVHPSRSLGEVVRATNKFSNNMMARHLLLTLGTLNRNRGSTVSDGVNVLREWLGSKGIDVPGLKIVNGAGLSRDSRVSALGMANVLRAGYASRYAPEFLAALPIAGTDPALDHRHYEGEGTMVRMKTGLIDHVRAMAAYITAASGRTYIAVLLVNHPDAHTGLGTRLQDALIEYVLDH